MIALLKPILEQLQRYEEDQNKVSARLQLLHQQLQTPNMVLSRNCKKDILAILTPFSVESGNEARIRAETIRCIGLIPCLEAKIFLEGRLPYERAQSVQAAINAALVVMRCDLGKDV